MIDPTTLKRLLEINEEIIQRIQAYADKHNISFEEAKKRAKLVIEGKEIEIGSQDEI